jgi:hypothetical protein
MQLVFGTVPICTSASTGWFLTALIPSHPTAVSSTKIFSAITPSQFTIHNRNPIVDHWRRRLSVLCAINQSIIVIIIINYLSVTISYLLIDYLLFIVYLLIVEERRNISIIQSSWRSSSSQYLSMVGSGTIVRKR